MLKDILKKAKELKKTVTKTVEKLDNKYEITEKVSDLKNKAVDTLEDVKDKAEEINDKYEISKKASAAVDTVVDKASDLKEDISEKIEATLEDKITFDDFTKVELKIGKVLEAEEVKKSKKLLKLTVDFNEEEPRQIISGIKEYYSTDDIKGKKLLFVTNLLPRKIMGLESNGMILGLHDEDTFSLITPDKKKITPGSQAG